MSKSAQSKTETKQAGGRRPSRFMVVAGGVLVLAAIGGLASWPHLQTYLAQRAAEYAATAANQPSQQQAIAGYELANALDPGNASYRNQLAGRYLKGNRPDAAIGVLGDTAGERVRKAELLMQRAEYDSALAALQPVTTPAAAVVRSRVYLERGSGGMAIAAVRNTTTTDARTELQLSYLAAGQANAAQQLVTKYGKSVSGLLQSPYNSLTIAQVLYTHRLYRSMQRVLTASADSSPAKYQLLAAAALAQQPQTHTQLTAAQQAAAEGLQLDPANLPLRQLLQTIDNRLGDQAGAAHQQQLIDRLRTGQI